MIKYFSIFAVFILSGLSLLASSDFIVYDRFIKYGIQNGLINNIIFDIKQDNDGYIWCATEEGLTKFNGFDFVNYKWILPSDKSVLTNYTALRILCEENKVYIATHFGLYVYDVETESFKVYRNNTSTITDDQNNQIRSIIKRKKGGFWVGTYGGGVFAFDPKTERFERLNYDHGDDRILSLYEDENELLYVGTHFGGLDIVDIKNARVRHFNVKNNTFPDNQIESIFRDSNGNTWVGTWSGLLVFAKGSFTPTLIERNELKNAKVNSLAEDKSGNLWVGTEYFMCCFNIENIFQKKLYNTCKFYYESETDIGLSYKTIRCVFPDKDNNIWIGTYSGGINFINQFKQKFNHISSDPFHKNSLSYKRISSFSEDNKGNLWITTDGGGVNYWDIKNNIFTRITSENKQFNLSDDAVLCSLVDSDQDVWFGTYNCVLNRKINGTNRFIQYKHSEHEPSLHHSDLSFLYEDSKKLIWIGQRTGLSFFDKKTNKFTVIESMKWYHITGISEYKNDLIIGTLSGLYRYNYETGSVEPFDPKLTNVLVNTFLFDRRGNLWVGTSGQGLWEYDLKNDSITLYDESKGLESVVIQKLTEIGDNSIWLSTNKSISKLSLDTKEIENYRSNDGIQPGMFLRNSGLKMKSGLIAFGGTEGMNIFDPASIRRGTLPIRVVFTRFSLFNQPVNVRTKGNPNSPLTKEINSTDEITLKYNESVFTIDYLGINYSSPEKIEYAYMLEGLDKDWNRVKNKRSVTYQNLKPGTYHFKVTASSPSGAFDQNVARTLKITISPPFWLTWWAYLIYIIFSCVVVFFIWNIITMKMRSHNQIKFERLEREKAEELHQAKLQFFTNISHELKTPLTLILAPIDKLLGSEKSDDRKYLLSLIKKNALRVINDVNKIIDIRKVDRGQMILKVEQSDAVPLIKEIVSSFENVANDKNINLIFTSINRSLVGWICPGFIDKIVYNILSNAFKFTADYGEIVVNLSILDNRSREYLFIEISDTGIGIADKNIEKIFERFHQEKHHTGNIVNQGSGIGLHLVKSLVELHKGQISVNSKLDVGTTFTILIPFEKNAYDKDEIDESKNERANSYRSKFDHSSIDYTAMSPQYIQNQTENKDKKYKILVAEDEPDIRNFIAAELRDEYDIIQAGDGKAGLNDALKYIPDLIISDILMPEMNGIEFCKAVKENINTCHIPIILLTAKDTHEDKLQGLEAGADSYIPKPFDLRHLHIRVKQLIKSRETMKDKFVKKINLYSKKEEVRDDEPDISEEISYDDRLMKKIIDYITLNIANPDIKGESIAEHVAMSRMSLHRKLKALIGLSAGDLIRDIRLEFACKELRQSDKTITEISYDAGFSSPSYFYTCFVKKYGLSPTDYLKKHSDETRPKAG